MASFPREKDLEDRVVIGVDEFNNGRSYSALPLVVVAYTSLPGEVTRRHVKKHVGFSSNETRWESWRPSAVKYLQRHPNFRYYTLRERTGEWGLFSIGRLEATARLIYETAKLVQKQEPIVILDGKPFCEDAEEFIARALQDHGIDIQIFFRSKADKMYSAVKTADRLAYILGSFYAHRSPRSVWPCRQQTQSAGSGGSCVLQITPAHVRY